MFKFKKNQGLAQIAILVIAALVIGAASVFIVKKDDGVVEEVAENVIEKELGLAEGCVDLTPNSKE